MKKQITTGLIVAGVMLLVFFSYKGNKASLDATSFKSESNGVIEILENNKSLGDISMKDGKIQIPFTLKNVGSETVVLGKASTSCMCTDAYLLDAAGKKSTIIRMNINPFLDETVAPGESRDIIALFDPNAHGPRGTGPMSRSVIIETNSRQTPGLSFSFFGNVVK